MPWATQMSDDGVELDELSGGQNGVRKVSALQLSEVVSAGDPSASPSPRDLVKKTLHQVWMWSRPLRTRSNTTKYSYRQIARDGDIAALNRVMGDKDEGTAFIDKHINELDEKKLTPLHYAARDEMQLLQWKSDCQNTDILSKKWAVTFKKSISIYRYSHLEMLRELVRLKAEINKAGDDDMTPLHYAARWDNSLHCQCTFASNETGIPISCVL